jgi:bifunctional dethiobiotin synthetase / adenosylmethionine---8-amino-7-oxononanoate aminotransferase
VLVGDGRLGGISSTISSWEALHRRGYDVPFIVIAEDEKRALGNSGVIRGAVVGRGVVDIVELPPLPPLPHRHSTSSSSSSTTTTTTTTTNHNHNHINNIIDIMLQEWLEESSSQFDSLLIHMKEWHTERLATLSSSPSRAEKVLWWPFTQHASINSNNKTMIIDGRAGESFLTISTNTNVEKDSSSNVGNMSSSLSTKDMKMVPLYDGCASWWTQGVGSRQQQDIADAISHAAARYGHVMFPENTHQPALNVAEKLLSTVGDGWADRVFYSDNGSTAIEVAIKMAFRKYMMDHNILDSREAEGGGEGGRGGGTSSPPPSLGVIGIQEAYHGDTLGAMDAVAPSVFNGRRQTPWYTGRGLFLPAKLFDGSDSNRSSTNTDMEKNALASYFNGKIDEYESITPNHRLGALILEPVMQGAGGMRVIDPMWQSSLVKVCKQRKIPVIYDEVFTGLFRLGWKSAGPAVLDMTPDIACYAKLLTGGMVPLAVTLASADVFNCFLGSTKIQALLHGHSYTAHAIGCAAAEYSLDIFFSKIKGGERLGVLWDVDQAQHIAEKLGGVERVTALGTVLVFDFGDAGSDRARAFALLLKQYGGIYTRPLGGVTYLMVTPLTTKDECRQLLSRVEGALIKGGYGSGNGEKDTKMCIIHDGQFM